MTREAAWNLDGYLPEDLPALDSILRTHGDALGRDFEAYRNHAHRVAHLCIAQSSRDADRVERIEIAAAFHDLGIWTAGTFDYLQPSVMLAASHLAVSGRSAWIPEVTAMILEHHKVFRYRGEAAWLVEPFRRADWIDVSLGAVGFGMPRRFLDQLVARWPRAGFHARLAQLEARQLITRPWNPLPMLRL